MHDSIAGKALMKRIVGLLLVTVLSSAAHGASFTAAPAADAFVTTGPDGSLSGSNYGGAGGLTVAAPGLPRGEAQSVLRFDLAAAASSFDAALGAGQWNVQSVTLRLTAAPAGNETFNTPAAGSIAISWMLNDAWTEGTGTPSAPAATGITFTSLQSTYVGASDEALGTFAWSGATSGVFDYALSLSPGLLADALAGSQLSLRMLAADSTVSGVFNSRSFANPASRPSLVIVAVPEPGTLALHAVGLALLATLRGSRRLR
jgi:hypothetical protein